MKILHKILLVVMILFTGSVYAQENEEYLSSELKNDYSVSVKADDKLSKGNNDINVKILHKGHIAHNVNVTLKMYQPNDQVVEYKNSITNKKGNYSFKIDLPKKGDYRYVISFNKKLGVTRYSRGGFTL